MPSDASTGSSGSEDDPRIGRSSVGERFLWIGAIWVIAWSGMIAEGAMSSSDPSAGAKSFAMQGTIFAPFMLIVLVPVGLVGWWIGSRKRLRPWRWPISLILPVLLSFSGLVGGIGDRLDPGRRITRLTGVGFPDSAKLIKCEFSGGYLADLCYRYEFVCPRHETDRLIRELELTMRRQAPGSPAGRSGFVEVGSASDVGHAGYVELHVDASRTRVLLICGTI